MTTEVAPTESVKEEFKDSVEADLREEFKAQLKPELKAELKTELTHKNWHAAHVENSTFKDRAADMVARAMGSWSFIMALLVVITLWVVGNVVTIPWIHFDPYPFILLNLFFSLQATLSTPIILMSQNRAASRDKAQAEHQWNHQEFEMRENTELTRAIHELTTEIHRRGQIPPGLQRLISEVRTAREEASRRKQNTRTLSKALQYLTDLDSATKETSGVES